MDSESRRELLNEANNRYHTDPELHNIVYESSEIAAFNSRSISTQPARSTMRLAAAIALILAERKAGRSNARP